MENEKGIFKKIIAVLNNIEIIAVIVILILLIISINENNHAFKGYIDKLETNTEKQIVAGKEATLVQIQTIIEASDDQINNHRKNTEQYLEVISKAEKERKRALLTAMINECVNNLNAIRHLSKMALDQEEDLWKFPQITFSYEAYQANLYNATIETPELVSHMVDVYCNLKIIQNFIDNARNPVFTIEARRAYLKQAVRNGSSLLDIFEQVDKAIREYKKFNYDKKEEESE